MKILPANINTFIENIDNDKETNAVLIFGQDQSVVNTKFRNIKENFSKGNVNFSYITQEVLKKNPTALYEEFQSISMFGEKNIIILNLEERANDYTKYIKDIFDNKTRIDDTSYIIITAGDLNTTSSLRKFCESSKNIAVIACYEESQQNMINIISKKLKEEGFIFSKEVVNYLYENIGTNVLLIEKEIEKISLYKDQDKNLGVEDLTNCIKDVSENTISDFINAFCSFEKNKTFIYLNKLLVNNAPIILIRGLIFYFLQLQKIQFKKQNGEDLEKIIKEERIFWKQTGFLKQHLEKWNLNKINLILEKFIDLEKKAKFSTSNLEFEDFVLRSFLVFNKK